MRCSINQRAARARRPAVAGRGFSEGLGAAFIDYELVELRKFRRFDLSYGGERYTLECAAPERKGIYVVSEDRNEPGLRRPKNDLLNDLTSHTSASVSWQYVDVCELCNVVAFNLC